MQVERCFAGGKLRPGKIIRFIFPTYLTSLFTTLYTIMDGVFVSTLWGPMLWRPSTSFTQL